MEGSAGPGLRANRPPAPRLPQPPAPTIEAASLPFRSASGKRAHPRVAMPAMVEIAGVHYRLADLSVGGFALEDDGPAAALDDPFRVMFRIGQPHLSLAIEATVKVRRLAGDFAKSFQIIEISPDGAVALERLVAIWLSGSDSLAAALSRASLEATEPAEAPARNRRSLLVFGAAALGLLLAAGYVASTRLIVYSEFGAVSAPMSVIRAPQPGLLVLQAGAPGMRTEPGQVLGELRPELPTQVLAETTHQINAFEARLRQLEGELSHGEAGFRAFRAQAEADLAAASETRRLMERQVATQERLFSRLEGLSRQGIVAGARADQEEINLMNYRRSLAEARAAEHAAQLLAGEARAGRFRSDGRPTARSPEEVRREIAAVTSALADMRQTLARLGAAVPLISPCLCRVAQLVVPSGTAVLAGDVLLGLAAEGERAPLEVDALVPGTRMPFLALGQRVDVRLAGARDVTPGRIIALNHNPENAGRIGLPDNLRSLRIYGLVTVALDAPAQGILAGGIPVGGSPPAIGLPALLQAPISLRMLLLNLPGFSWIARIGG